MIIKYKINEFIDHFERSQGDKNYILNIPKYLIIIDHIYNNLDEYFNDTIVNIGIKMNAFIATININGKQYCNQNIQYILQYLELIGEDAMFIDIINDIEPFIIFKNIKNEGIKRLCDKDNKIIIPTSSFSYSDIDILFEKILSTNENIPIE